MDPNAGTDSAARRFQKAGEEMLTFLQELRKVRNHFSERRRLNHFSRASDRDRVVLCFFSLVLLARVSR